MTVDMTMLKSASGPDPIPCTKCGSDAGWKGPRYDNERAMTIALIGRSPVRDAALMVWTCRQCGYERWTKPLDARAAAPTADRRPSLMERLFGRRERA